MSFVTSIFARRMVQAAGDSVDAPGLLRSIGLDPSAPLDVAQMVAADAYYDLLERIAGRLDRGHELPLRVGPLMRPDDYGALGLAWKSAPNVRQSLERVARYCRLWTDNMTYEVRERPDGIDFLLHRAGERRLGMRLSNEATIASAVSLIRQTALDRFRPLEVRLRHPAPTTTTAHEVYFGCPVRFGAVEDSLTIGTEALDAPNRLADDGISRFLLSHLDQEIETVEAEVPLAGLVRQAISRALSEGVPRMADIARRLAMSERTLQRRLADEGLSFKSVVDATRRELAENLLRNGRYSVSEVAFLTGFSEQSAFHRAFRRWTDQTPTAFRDRVGA
jgi:AraC-like DNA-binding protein